MHVRKSRVGLGWHIEFTECHEYPVSPSPTNEDLLVLYIPNREEWLDVCLKMDNAGFNRVSSFNPYWDIEGVTFSDCDGYRVVLQNGKWG